MVYFEEFLLLLIPIQFSISNIQSGMHDSIESKHRKVNTNLSALFPGSVVVGGRYGTIGIGEL